MQPSDRQLQSPVVLLVTLPVVAHIGEGAARDLLSQIEPTIVFGGQIVRSIVVAGHFGSGIASVTLARKVLNTIVYKTVALSNFFFYRAKTLKRK
uniref:Uncharacterized protein n=1 Tax=Anopheles darlingi TaxID=43151 RepID=A0A2M4D620_ANODA